VDENGNKRSKRTKSPFDHKYAEPWVAGLEYFLAKDAPFYCGEMFRKVGAPITDWLKWSWQVIPKRIGASCACCFSPLQSDHDSYMVEHMGEPQPLVTFSLIPGNDETNIVVCWHKRHTELVKHLEERMQGGDDIEAFINGNYSPPT